MSNSEKIEESKEAEEKGIDERVAEEESEEEDDCHEKGSFAPSPIAKVTFLGNLFLIIFTISAFYFGDTLHAKTTSAKSEAPKNISLRLSFASITTRDFPSIIIDYF